MTDVGPRRSVPSRLNSYLPKRGILLHGVMVVEYPNLRTYTGPPITAPTTRGPKTLAGASQALRE